MPPPNQATVEVFTIIHATAHPLTRSPGTDIVMAPLSGAFGGLLASAILSSRGFGGIPDGSWRLIFVIEGIVTVFVGLVGLFLLTDRPETARWLTQEEKDLAVARLKSERIVVTTGRI
jgi:sugar phosphate permease